MLDLRVLLERVDRHVLAVAALLVAAVWHLVDERDVRVDPHGAELQLAGHAQRAADIARPDGRGEAVLDAVGPLERLLLVAEPLDRHHRAEDLLGDDLRVGSGWHDDRRLVPRAWLLDPRATGEHLGAGLPRPVDEA